MNSENFRFKRLDFSGMWFWKHFSLELQAEKCILLAIINILEVIEILLGH